MSLIQSFYRDFVLILTEPRDFFKTRYPEYTLSKALAFGIAIQWIAAFLGWITRLIKHESLMDGFRKIRDQFAVLPIWKDIPDSFWQQGLEAKGLSSAWIMELLGILISPFTTLMNLSLYGVVLYLGAMVLIPRSDGIHRDKAGVGPMIQLCALSCAPLLLGALLGFLPLGLGSLIAFIYSVAILTIGLSVRYSISYPRALTTILLPGIASILILSCVIGVFAAALVGMLGALFHAG